MINVPTDRIYKFAAVGGLVLSIAAGNMALNQYHETALQNAEFYGKTMELTAVYQRFASQARDHGERVDKLPKTELTDDERSALVLESEKFKERIPEFDKEFEHAKAAALRQQAVTAHFYRIQTIKFILAGSLIICGLLASFWGFRIWLSK